MPVEKTIKQFSNFSKGIMTESTPLNFPDNYALDEANLTLKVDGSRERRRGIEYESGYALTATTTTTASVGMSFYKWENADNNVLNTIGVVQVGQDLYFMDLETTNPSANLLNGGAPLSITGAMTDTNVQTPLLSFATLNGVLLCTSADFDQPQKITYDGVNFTLATQPVLVRDLWGVDDSLRTDERPTSTYAGLTDEHEYNLFNQGWTDANLTSWDTAGTDMPSNADIMHTGKNSSGVWSKGDTILNFFGNSPAPKGRFIINFLDRGTGAAGLDATYNRTAQHDIYGTTLTALPDDIETGCFAAVATNFGRVFWAGSESSVTDGDAWSPNSSALILFSQIVERDDQFGLCYTEADPTAEIVNNQVDSDGGWIQIPELGKVIKMVALNNQLIIFASNGVWTLNTDAGLFTPTAYQVNKITDIGVSGLDSIIEVEGTIIYWSESGIYQMTLNEISQKAVVQDVTLQTIKTLYNQIPTRAKENAKGYYDSINKQIGWLYQSDASWDFDNYPDFCNKELIYDLQLQAFTVNTHSSKTIQSPYVVGAVLGQTAVSADIITDVVVNGDQVQVNADDVQQTLEQTITTNTNLKYLTYVPSGGFANFTLSTISAEEFLDWGTEDYESYLETGHISFEDWSRRKSIPYLIAHFERTEDGFDADLNPTNESSCYVQARWEWTDSAASNKWGTEFQAYRYRRPYVPVDANDLFETGHTIITTRNKIRGSGKAARFRFRSETGKNFKLLGFAITATGSTNV